jgi:hypothetical protein
MAKAKKIKVEVTSDSPVDIVTGVGSVGIVEQELQKVKLQKFDPSLPENKQRDLR